MKSRRTISKRSSKEVLRQLDDTSDDDVIGIICPVWPGGCHHPELCKDECFDDDLVRERAYIDNGTKE